MPELLVKIYLSGIGVFLFLTVFFPEVMYKKHKLEKIKTRIAEAPLPDNLKALAWTVALVINAVCWPWMLAKKFLFKSKEGKEE